MKEKKILILLFTIISIQPVLAQSGSDVSAQSTAQEKPVQEEEAVININLASDSEFIQALKIAGDIELVNEETEKNDKTPNQGKAK